MDCINEGLIQAYIDGEVLSDEKLLIENHISICSECAKKVENQKIISSSIVNAVNVLAKDPIRLKRKISQKSDRFSLKKLVYIVSAASALLFALIYFNSNNQSAVSHPQIYYEMDWSVDANKPIADQDFTINVYDVDDSHVDFSIQ